MVYPKRITMNSLKNTIKSVPLGFSNTKPIIKRIDKKEHIHTFLVMSESTAILFEKNIIFFNNILIYGNASVLSIKSLILKYLERFSPLFLLEMSNNLSNNLLNVYGKFMNLKIYVPVETNEDLELKQ